MALSVITLRGGLRVMVFLMMCCAILAHISAMDETLEAQRRVEAGGTETGELKPSLLYRGRRAVQKNSTPNLTEVEKRLKSMEERYVGLIS